MAARALIVGAVVALVMATAGPGWAQEGDRAAQKRPDGSLVGRLGDAALELGTFHALLIGINDYHHTDFAPKLRTAVSDVQALARVLIDDYGFKNVKLVLDRQATRAGILRALAEFRDMPLGPADNLLIYYAGHGHQRPDTQDGFWLPADATADEFTWISVADIRRIVKNIKAKHTLLVSDSCFSGTLSRATVSLPSNDRFLREVFLKDSYQVITSGGLEPVADGGRDGLSLFAYNFVGYLKQQTRPYVTAGHLYADVAPLVANASGSRQTPEHGKIPDTFDQNGQFVFARAAGGLMAAVSPAPTAALASPMPGAASRDANVTQLASALFVSPQRPWELRPEKLDQPGAEQLPFHLAEKGAQIRVVMAPMAAIEMAKEPPQFREDIAKLMLESFRTAWEKAGLRGWRTGNAQRGVVDGLDLYAIDAGASGLWVRVAVARNDTDGRSYMIMVTSPQKYQKDLVSEYERLLASWKWMRR